MARKDLVQALNRAERRLLAATPENVAERQAEWEQATRALNRFDAQRDAEQVQAQTPEPPATDTAPPASELPAWWKWAAGAVVFIWLTRI